MKRLIYLLSICALTFLASCYTVKAQVTQTYEYTSIYLDDPSNTYDRENFTGSGVPCVDYIDRIAGKYIVIKVPRSNMMLQTAEFTMSGYWGEISNNMYYWGPNQPVWGIGIGPYSDTTLNSSTSLHTSFFQDNYYVSCQNAVDVVDTNVVNPMPLQLNFDQTDNINDFSFMGTDTIHLLIRTHRTKVVFGMCNTDAGNLFDVQNVKLTFVDTTLTNVPTPVITPSGSMYQDSVELSMYVPNFACTPTFYYIVDTLPNPQNEPVSQYNYDFMATTDTVKFVLDTSASVRAIAYYDGNDPLCAGLDSSNVAEDDFTIHPVSVGENEVYPKPLSLYPNPSGIDEPFFIDVPTRGTLEVYNTVGALIETKQYVSPNTRETIHINECGGFIVKFVGDNGELYVGRLIRR